MTRAICCRVRWWRLDAARSTVYGQADKVVLLLGVEDLVVVDTEDALLVCAKDAGLSR